MLKEITNITITSKVHEFCKNYVLDRSEDKRYDNGNLSEYYPERENFIRNFNFVDICIGKITNGIVSPHIDEYRDSVLIVPFNEITIITGTKTTFKNPFIIDTTKLHGAESTNNALFIGIDFHKTYDEIEEYLNSMPKLYLSVL